MDLAFSSGCGSPPVGAYLRKVAGGRRRDEGRADRLPSRVGFVGYRPRSRRYRGKHAVCYFDYRYEVGGQTYTGKVRKKENLHTARIGDSVVVRYLSDNPGVHRLVTDSAGRYKVDRCARGRSRSRR